MRTIPTAAFALLATILVAAPPALAANAVAPNDIILTDGDGTVLQFIPQDDIVRIRIVVNNTASTTVNETLTLHIVIDHEDGSVVFDQTIRRAVTIPAGQSTIIEQSWPPSGRRLGNHTLTVAVQDSTEAPYAATFIVTETAVVAGSYAEKVARYSWFLGTFVVAALLFVVVLMARRA